MTSVTVTVVFAAVVAISMVGGWIGAARVPTIHAFFWGDQRLSSQFGTSLLLSGSFSLNGLLYQSWLGYSTGWWSLLVQVVWCLGYVMLAVHTPRFGNMLKAGTLHGIIASFFGLAAGRIACTASLIGFAIMIGWEASVGATLLRGVTGESETLSIAVPIAVAMMAGLYTCAGGLRGTAIVNFGHNIFKATVLIAALFALVWTGPLGPTALVRSGAAVTSAGQALESLGGIAIISNLAFSAMWQVCDMSNWQDISSVRDTRNRRRRVIVTSALLVFVFPGLIGTMFGIVLSSLPIAGEPVTDSNILAIIIAQVAGFPLLKILLLAACGAAMLSTIDGLALSAAQSLTWDLTNRVEIQTLLPLGPDRPPNDCDEMIIVVSRVGVLLVCACGATATFVMTDTLGPVRI